jgi:hypothetical protein
MTPLNGWCRVSSGRGYLVACGRDGYEATVVESTLPGRYGHTTTAVTLPGEQSTVVIMGKMSRSSDHYGRNLVNEDILCRRRHEPSQRRPAHPHPHPHDRGGCGP